jgi:capsular polysaccharide biosynthesis protein
MKKLIKAYIPVAAVTVSVCVVIAIAATLLMPDKYKGDMTLAIGTEQDVVSGRLGAEAQPVTNTVSQLLRANVVAEEVIEELGLDLPAREFTENLTVEQKPDAAALDITYVGDSPEQAVSVLQTLVKVFDARLGEVANTSLGGEASEGATGGTGAEGNDVRIAVRVFDPPHASDIKVSPRPVRNVGIAVFLGLLIAAFWLAFRDALATRPEDEDQEARRSSSGNTDASS